MASCGRALAERVGRQRTHILVHQTGLSNAAVTKDNHLEQKNDMLAKSHGRLLRPGAAAEIVP